ncbi:MAG TPA: DegT/DnrJ/EryC1/StrS family aminotransferase [Acidimicrobiales bacterium]|nr:DegT/DnrJ/EryC1/StrS family aminotransferase [Acidimicrobiales bacterium]
MPEDLEGPLAVLGGRPAFDVPRSTAALPTPDLEEFLRNSRTFFDIGRYTDSGPTVRRLEAALAEFHQVEHVVAVSGGFWAVALTARLVATSGRPEVVFPSLTYRRLADLVSWVPLIPRFCEVDAATLAMTVETVDAVMNDNVGLILGVHPIVGCADSARLEAYADRVGVPIMFDSVESTYESIGGRRVGGFGQAECFSLHASKLVNGFEGGYVTTNDAQLAERLRRARGQGFNNEGDLEEVGINATMPEVHAAASLACLARVDDIVETNRALYEAYEDALSGVQGLRLLPFDIRFRPSYKVIVVEVTEVWPLSREETLAVLHAEGVLARPYYSPALHQKATGYEMRFGDLSLTDRLSERFLLLACGERTTPDDARRVVSLLVSAADNAEQVKKALA